MSAIPLVDVSALLGSGAPDRAVDGVARAIDEACRHHGFFYAVGHGVAPSRMEDQKVTVGDPLPVDDNWFRWEQPRDSPAALRGGGVAALL